jgi:hypothetical protein
MESSWFVFKNRTPSARNNIPNVKQLRQKNLAPHWTLNIVKDFIPGRRSKASAALAMTTLLTRCTFLRIGACAGGLAIQIDSSLSFPLASSRRMLGRLKRVSNILVLNPGALL